ncbi:P-loop containing nucleoside triphosphate hydrolase protein [Aspergillus germanicus]
MSLTLSISTQCRRTAYSHLLDPVQRVHGLIPLTKSIYPRRRSYTPRRRSTFFDIEHSAPSTHDTGTDVIGREKELEKLWHSLRPRRPPKRQITVLHGPHGVGKTLLAAQFAHMHVNDFGSIWWIDSSSKKSMLASLGKLASKLPTGEILSNLSQPSSGEGILERRVSMVSDYLASGKDTRWLLVVDRLAAEKVKLDDFIPGSDHGSILVTTTSPQPQVLQGECSAVKPLNPEDALVFLTNPASDGASEMPSSETEDQAKKMLIRHLEGLPLALVLAAECIQQTGLSTSSYLSLYLETRRAAPTTEKCPLRTACELSYQEVKLSNPLAANTLLLLSCYNHTDIPSCLLEYARQMPQTDTILQISDREMQQAIRILKDFSLITINHQDGLESYTIHPTIQSWCRSIIPKNEREQQNLHSTALHSLGKAAAASTLSQQHTFDAQQQSLLPHADEMHRFLKFDCSLPLTTEIVSAIMNIGILYHSHGLLSDAECMYLHALSHSENLHGRWHPTRRRILRTLRRIRFQRGRMGHLVAQYWWASVLLRTAELLAGSVLIILSVGTWLILAIIVFFAWLVIGLARMKGQTDSDKGLDLDEEERRQNGSRAIVRG